MDLRRFRGLFKTENSARKGEHCRSDGPVGLGDDPECLLSHRVGADDTPAVL